MLDCADFVSTERTGWAVDWAWDIGVCCVDVCVLFCLLGGVVGLPRGGGGIDCEAPRFDVASATIVRVFLLSSLGIHCLLTWQYLHPSFELNCSIQIRKTPDCLGWVLFFQTQSSIHIHEKHFWLSYISFADLSWNNYWCNSSFPAFPAELFKLIDQPSALAHHQKFYTMRNITPNRLGLSYILDWIIIMYTTIYYLI